MMIPFDYLLDVCVEVLNKKPHNTVSPQACNQVTSETPATALTKQPFHSRYTGKLSKKLSSSRPAIPNIIEPRIVIICFMMIPCCDDVL